MYTSEEKNQEDTLRRNEPGNTSMKIFLSYGHDSNAPLIEKIKEYLSKDAEGNTCADLLSNMKENCHFGEI